MRRVVHWYRRRFLPTAVILLYHRIIDLPSDPYLLSVSPGHFAEHLAVLRNQSWPISLRKLVDVLREGRILRRAVVITFDDGYFDNLAYAKPLLERRDIPATVFVTPGSLPDAGSEFWWDTLERIMLQPGQLPQELQLVIGGVPHEWQLGSVAEYGADDYARHRSWNYGCADDPTARHAIFRSVHQLLKVLDPDERRRVLRDMAIWAGADTSMRPTHRVLSAAETIDLAEGGLVELGAHTMTHPVLSKLPVARQRNEIRESKVYLEKLLGRSVTSFAYPHGLQADYTQESVQIVRENGFDSACVATPGPVRFGVDIHQLPRFVVCDQDGDAFAAQLSTYFKE